MTSARSDEDLTFNPLPDLAYGQRWASWDSIERLCRGPEPRPSWVIEGEAIETELGIVKTGKEADVFLIERASAGEGGRACLLAAKRYRTAEHRQFRRDGGYTEGRRTRNTRDARALAKKSTFGRQVAAGQWADAEWWSLRRLWELGVPVPYPVQIDGTEILMEYVEFDGAAAPRLAQTRPERDLATDYFHQTRDAMLTMSRAQCVHGDLSPYNILAEGERIVIIDVPQLVDLVGNPNAMTFLQRDCHNICTWFASRGVSADEDVLFSELVAEAFS